MYEIAKGPFVMFNNFPFAYPPRPADPEKVTLSGCRSCGVSFLCMEFRLWLASGSGKTSYGFQSARVEMRGAGVGSGCASCRSG